MPSRAAGETSAAQRLWPDDADDKVKLHLDHHTTYANGVQLQVFRRA